MATGNEPVAPVTSETPTSAVDWSPTEKRADSLVVIFYLLAVASLIAGASLAWKLSQETTEGVFGLDETTYDGAIVAYWVVAGVVSAALWLLAGTILALLRDISRELRLGRETTVAAAPPHAPARPAGDSGTA